MLSQHSQNEIDEDEDLGLSHSAAPYIPSDNLPQVPKTSHPSHVDRHRLPMSSPFSSKTKLASALNSKEKNTALQNRQQQNHPQQLQSTYNLFLVLFSLNLHHEQETQRDRHITGDVDNNIRDGWEATRGWLLRIAALCTVNAEFELVTALKENITNSTYSLTKGIGIKQISISYFVPQIVISK